jgi:hypothetical protein
MAPTHDATTARVGTWAALAGAAVVIASVPALMAVGNEPWTGLADYASTFRDVELMPFALWMALAPLVVVAVACLREAAPRGRRVFGDIALAFASTYATIVGTVYGLQLAYVRPAILRGDLSGLDPWVAANVGSAVFALDLTAYLFLGIATLALVPLFRRGRVDRVLQALLLVHGVSGFAGLGVLGAGLLAPGGDPAVGNAVLAAWALLIGAILGLVAWTFRRAPSTLPRDASRADPAA